MEKPCLAENFNVLQQKYKHIIKLHNIHQKSLTILIHLDFD